MNLKTSIILLAAIAAFPTSKSRLFGKKYRHNGPGNGQHDGTGRQHDGNGPYDQGNQYAPDGVCHGPGLFDGTKTLVGQCSEKVLSEQWCELPSGQDGIKICRDGLDGKVDCCVRVEHTNKDTDGCGACSEE